MSRRYRTQLIFGVVAAVAIVALFLVLQTTTTWPWYYTWPLAATVVAFFTYAMDKGMAKANTVRVPEVVLHLLALVGGFTGALVGMFLFRHKSNFRAHPLFLPIIILGGALWGFIIFQMTQ